MDPASYSSIHMDPASYTWTQLATAAYTWTQLATAELQLIPSLLPIVSTSQLAPCFDIALGCH